MREAGDSRCMKKMLLHLAPVVLWADGDPTRSMPRDPYEGCKVERLDGGHGTGMFTGTVTDSVRSNPAR